MKLELAMADIYVNSDSHERHAYNPSEIPARHGFETVWQEVLRIWSMECLAVHQPDSRLCAPSNNLWRRAEIPAPTRRP